MRFNRDALSAEIAKQTRSARRLPRRLSHAAHVALQIVYWTATFQLRAALRRRRDARLIRHSGIFDPQFYLAQCPDDADAQENPVHHYLEVGAARGLDPSPLFDSSEYAARNQVAVAASENPLAHFIRSRAAGRNGAVASARGPRATASGEPLLLGHPFRASPSPASVLVVGARPPDLSRALGRSADARVLALLGLLREMGYPVTFVSAAAEARREDVEALQGMGIAVRCGFEAALGHIAEEGHGYRASILSGPEQAWRYVTVVRAYAPQATVIYHRGKLPSARRLASLPGELGESPERVSGSTRLDEISAACADVVLVRTPWERDALLRRSPDASVEIVPDAGALAAAPGGRDDLYAPIVKGRLELAIAATRPAAGHERLVGAVERPRLEAPRGTGN